MTTAQRAPFLLGDAYARALPELAVPWRPDEVPDPRLVTLNDSLAAELGIVATELREPQAAAILAGTLVPEGAHPVAMAYAGHQFGGYSPRLGDGRAVLLGELRTATGRLVDLHLKGSGRTPFARGGDGKAVLGPMLREFLVAEAMHALGIPTSRALAVVTTGERIVRDGPHPGAVLARVAASHLRVGTFQYAASLADPHILTRLADYAIGRHLPEAAGAPGRYLALFKKVVDAQACLVARWMLVGFIHGVLNTDNTLVSGEGMDYGPCAFMDRYHPATVFSSIDHAGRYAYGNQPAVIQWNLARFAETLIGLVDDEPTAAVEALSESLGAFPQKYREHWEAGMRAKLGLATHSDDDAALFDDLMTVLGANGLDHTSSFRSLSATLRGATVDSPLAAVASGREWVARWRARLEREANDQAAVAEAMDRVNPIYIPRNHLVEEALAAAEAEDLGPFQTLVDVVTHPFEERPGFERFAQQASETFTSEFQTFCGT